MKIVLSLLLFVHSTNAFVSILPKRNIRSRIYNNPSKLIEEVSKTSGNKVGSEWTFYDFTNNAIRRAR